MNSFLICEDDQDMQDLLKIYLNSKNHSFKMVSFGNDVVPTLKNEKIDFVLLDLNLPDIDGKEVISKIRREDDIKTTPIIVFSASLQAKKLMKELGVDDILEKPFQLSELESIIARYSNTQMLN